MLRLQIVHLQKIYKFTLDNFSIKKIILGLDVDNLINNKKFRFSAKPCEIWRNCYFICNNCFQNYRLFSWKAFSEHVSFSFWYLEKKSMSKGKNYDENVILKINRALIKWNFLFYMKSKTNSVTCISTYFIILHILQYFIWL